VQAQKKKTEKNTGPDNKKAARLAAEEHPERSEGVSGNTLPKRTVQTSH